MPRVIALVGFDNPPCTISQHLPLTSIALPRYAVGKLADELLHFEINKALPSPFSYIGCHVTEYKDSGLRSQRLGNPAWLL